MTTYLPAQDAFHNPLDDFTDREIVLQLFDQYLDTPSDNPYILAIKGISGIGKTFLISYLIKRICPLLEKRWYVSRLAFSPASEPDFQVILASIGSLLQECVPADKFQEYLTKCEGYIHHFDEYRVSNTVHVDVKADNQSLIFGISPKVHIDAQLQDRRIHLRNEMGNALIELSKARLYPLCLFIDGYERLQDAAPELTAWFFGDILHRMCQVSSQPLRVVTCGWKWPDGTIVEPFYAQRISLEDFDLAQVRSYLEKRHVLGSVLDKDYATQLEGEELITAFSNLTKGHPLVLSLAVEYLKTLPINERTAQNLLAERPLINEKARIEFLQARLLKWLPEPYRTILERGPILRSFDQATLNTLLSIEIEGVSARLDDRRYEYLLSYPFIHQRNKLGDVLLLRPTFHDLIRQVQREALRLHHPITWKKLHHAMADYYKIILDDHRKRAASRQTDTMEMSSTKYLDWLSDIPESVRQTKVEFFYHALQTEELQQSAFEEWNLLTGLAIEQWRRQLAGLFLEVVQQLVEEDEPFLNRTKGQYGQYLIWLASFLRQEGRLESARNMLEEAGQIFEREGAISHYAGCINNIGFIYRQQGQLEQATSSYERALSLIEKMGDPADIGVALNNIAEVYRQQGKLEQALSYHERALQLFTESSDFAVATSLNNIGLVYQELGRLEVALNYHEQALVLTEVQNNPIGIAQSLDNIGRVYSKQGCLDDALSYHKRALSLHEQVGNPAQIARSLNSIGEVYRLQRLLEDALSYHKRALLLCEQGNEPTQVAGQLNNIGLIYQEQGQLEEALSYYEKAFSLRKQVDDPASIANSLNNIGSIYILQGQLQEALRYNEEALTLRMQVGNPVEIATSLNNIGFIYRQQGRLQIALEYHKRSLTFLESMNNPIDTACLLANIGEIYRLQGDLIQAISYYARSSELYECLGTNFESNLTYDLEALAICYSNSGDLEKGKAFYERVLVLREKIGNQADTAISLNNIGDLCRQQEMLEEALLYYKRALVCYEQIGDLVQVAELLNKIANIYYYQKHWDQSIEHYTKSLILHMHLGQGFEHYVVNELDGLTLCYYELGEKDMARSYYQQAQQIRQAINMDEE